MEKHLLHVYQTQIRMERGAPIAKPLNYAIGSTVLQMMRPDAMILHPLPRTVEIDRTVDDDPRVLYFKQAAKGLYVRLALLSMLMDNE